MDKKFVEEGGNVNTCDSWGMPILVSAVLHKHMHILQYLVEMKADINKRSIYVGIDDEMGLTALMMAVQSNNLPMVEYLVKNGAKFNIPRYLGTPEETLLMWVREYGSEQMKNYFKKICPIQDNDEG